MVGPRYLLDTDVLSEPLKAAPNAAVITRLKARSGNLAIASIVWHEANYGAHRLSSASRRKAIMEYLSNVVAPNMPILPYDAQAAAWHAIERARLEAIGRKPPFADGQIAAVAAVNSLVLVTRNVADFHFFRKIPIENWYLES